MGYNVQSSWEPSRDPCLVPPLQPCLPRLAPCTGTTLVSFLSCKCTRISRASGSSHLRFFLCGPFPHKSTGYLPSDTFTLRGSDPLSSTALAAFTKEVTKQLFGQLFVQCILFFLVECKFYEREHLLIIAEMPAPSRAGGWDRSIGSFKKYMYEWMKGF